MEVLGRSEYNTVGGWYGIKKKGLRGRLGIYISPLMESLELAEVNHYPKVNSMRANKHSL
jgi:hypothetical protein